MSRVHDDRRSRSSSSYHQQPYHAVSEVYTKEVTHRPIGPVSEFPPEILEILREEPRAAPHSPPLVRSREDTWTPENFPIVRVPSAQFTDILTELYDYHEVEKYTRRSVTPDFEPLRRHSEIVEQRAPQRPAKIPPPTYQVIPPTPEKNTPRQQQQHSGIPLTSASSESTAKKPLPMYEEYVKMQQDENRNIPIPRPRSRSKSPLTSSESEATRINNNNELLRHIDSSSSSESTEPEVTHSQKTLNPEYREHSDDVEKRYVYSHDVYVDSSTGRPFTPGREDLQEKKNCDKLKINVYFKPPHPPVEATYQLDEIEIEKQEDILISKLRPSRSATILSRSVSSNPSVRSTEVPTEIMESRRIPTRTSVLRKEHEILTVPLNRSQSVRQSRVSEHSKRSTASKTITERSIPIRVEDNSSINLDDIFPKMQHPQTVTHVQVPSRSSTLSRPQPSEIRCSIDKGDHPRQQRIPSVVSQNRSVHQQHVHIGTPELSLTRGISKTPSVQDYKVTRPSDRSPSFVSHAPSHKSERTPSEVRIPVTVTSTHVPPSSVPYRSQQQQKRQSPEELDYGRYPNAPSRFPGDRQSEEVPDLSYTRGISKTPSDKDYRVERAPSSTVHIPYNNPEKERIHQTKSVPSTRSSYRSQKTNKSIAPSERSQPVHKSETPDLPFTRGISKTPSDKDYRAERTPSSTVHIPYNNPEKERAYQQASPKHGPSGRTRSPARSPSSRVRSRSAKSRPNTATQGPFEEIVHIKERYERDETIRRFFPTTTTV